MAPPQDHGTSGRLFHGEVFQATHLKLLLFLFRGQSGQPRQQERLKQAVLIDPRGFEVHAVRRQSHRGEQLLGNPK